ncbi:formimidoylglutamase [Salmonella enterica subsp. enterica]|uniref:Formimidoylglutamase n=1 Tax=Salmonella enterica I TaxID=59201 RepID=A0A447MVL1_SALET|nr:formimidoylglutamase [Salmonella enterica subsp. enterica]
MLPVVEDLDCHDALAQMTQFIDKVDKIYLTIDLDVLPVWEMPAVSGSRSAGRAADTGSAFN